MFRYNYNLEQCIVQFSTRMQRNPRHRRGMLADFLYFQDISRRISKKDSHEKFARSSPNQIWTENLISSIDCSTRNFWKCAKRRGIRVKEYNIVRNERWMNGPRTSKNINSGLHRFAPLAHPFTGATVSFSPSHAVTWKLMRFPWGGETRSGNFISKRVRKTSKRAARFSCKCMRI